MKCLHFLMIMESIFRATQSSNYFALTIKSSSSAGLPPDIQVVLLRFPVIHFLLFHILSIRYTPIPLSSGSRYHFDPEYCLGILQSLEVIQRSNHIRLYRTDASARMQEAGGNIFLLQLCCPVFHLRSPDTRSCQKVASL